MTVLVFGDRAGRTHENHMLQEFLACIEDRWVSSADWIYVVANAMWNGAEIDLVCILPSAILVADFKGHGGRLTGTENGPWQADGVLVKGGRKANPYQQLRDNKFSVLEWIKSKSLLSGRNLGHIAAGVVFGRPIDDQLELPEKVRSWFYPTDLQQCAKLLASLSSPQLIIQREEAQEMVQRLGVTPLEWSSRRPQLRDIAPGQAKPPFRPPLTGQQEEALQALCSFVADENLHTFAVLGMTSTGKTRLISAMIEAATSAGKQALVLSPNRRLAERAQHASDSIYSHLYIGNQKQQDEQMQEDEADALNVIPLREGQDPDGCVYLVDDAHLLGNSPFATPDGKKYGSGQLLSDFFEFAKLGSSGRKVVFFGDPYQLQRAWAEESVLSGTFQQARGLKHQSLELTQLIDVTGGSAKLANAEKLVNAIRTGNYAALALTLDEHFRVVEKSEAATDLLERYRANPRAVWYLTDVHTQVNAFTQWVRERLHGRKSLDSLEEGDLLEIYVSPHQPDALTSRNHLYSGRRLQVFRVSRRNSYEQPLRGVQSGPVRFHSVECGLEGLESAEVHVFEEFLTAVKPELDKETSVAERVWRNRNKKALPKNQKEPQQALDGDVPWELPVAPSESPSGSPPEFAYVRYGYGSTVHHAQGMTQRTCYVNADHAAGRHSEAFFRWLYSALTVAEQELVLFNFTDIHPLDGATWNAAAAKVDAAIAIGAGWSFEPRGVASEADQRRSPPVGLDLSKDLLKSMAIWLRLAKAVEELGWQVVKVASHTYLEQFDLRGPQDETCRLHLSYNGKNMVTAMHVKESHHWPLLAQIAARCVAMQTYSPPARTLLETVQHRLARVGWRVVAASETPYRLAITVVRQPEERMVLEVNFDKGGLASSLRPVQCSEVGLLNEVQGALS
jgi:hypothetical protein